MKQRITCGTFILCIILSFAKAEIPGLEPALATLAAKAGKNLSLAFDTFTYADSKLGSPFSRYLEEEIGLDAIKSGTFRIFPRDKLEVILQTAEFNLSDAVTMGIKKETALNGIDVLLSGTFFEEAGGIRVFLSLIAVSSGTVAANASFLLPLAKVPKGISIMPDNYALASEVRSLIGPNKEAQPGSLAIKAWSVRGDGGIYREGERLFVNILPTKGCFLKIYNINASGELILLFPNEFHKDNFVKGGSVLSIPDANYPFSFDLGAPFGTEFIKVVASTVQFRDMESAFSPIGNVKSGTLPRGIKVNAAAAESCESSFSYTIIPKK